jgi:co-chaperonin GroES (HSP10)
MKLFSPFGSRVLVEIEKVETGSIEVPEAYQKSLEKAIGTIVETGPDVHHTQIGMRVVLAKYAGIDIQIADTAYRILHEEDIAGELHEQVVSTEARYE